MIHGPATGSVRARPDRNVSSARHRPTIAARGRTNGGSPPVSRRLCRFLLLAFLGSGTAAAGQVFPLRVSADGRYLVGATGQPWRLQSEFAWVLSVQASAHDVGVYLADRKARGFNAFTLMAIVRPGGHYGWPATNVKGDRPFLVADDFRTPNDRYFDQVDMIVDKAAAEEFAVLMFFTYAGYNGGNEGWYEVLARRQNTKPVCYAFGRYLAGRWRTKTNLLLMAGGDYTMPEGETRDRMHEILRGLRDGGCRQLAGSEWGGPDSLVTDQPGYRYGTDPATSDLQLDSFYGMGPDQSGLVFLTAGRAWSQCPVLPAYLEEPMQAYGSYTPLDSGRAGIRRYQHWSILAGGIAGSNWGMFELANHFVAGAWQSQLDDVAVRDQTRAFAFYRAIPWWRMRPSGTEPGYAGHTLIVSPNPPTVAHIAASVTDNGSTLVAYVPPTGTKPVTFAVDMRALASRARARWWNPATGIYTPATRAEESLPNDRRAQQFTTPGDNGTGSNDWILVLEATETLPAPDR